MENRYRGQCPVCSAMVEPMQGVAVKQGMKWKVYHHTCQGRKEPKRISAVFNIGGKEYYRNNAGKCIDAPCCGCCTI